MSERLINMIDAVRDVTILGSSGTIGSLAGGLFAENGFTDENGCLAGEEYSCRLCKDIQTDSG
jgi:hypothetical protein